MRTILYYITLVLLVFALLCIFSVLEVFVLKTTNSYFELMNACVAGTIVVMAKSRIRRLINKLTGIKEKI